MIKYKYIAGSLKNISTPTQEILDSLSPHINVLGKNNVQIIREICSQNDTVPSLELLRQAISETDNILSAEQKRSVRDLFASWRQNLT